VALYLQKNTFFQPTQLKRFALQCYSTSSEDKLSLHITTTKSYYHFSDFKGHQNCQVCVHWKLQTWPNIISCEQHRSL